MLAVLFMLFLFNSSAGAECSKNEVLKLIDKGFLKTEISSICGISKETTAPTREEDKWVTPENSICRNNGGKISYDICTANWYNAKKICNVSGGRLPDLSELKKLVGDCGGVIDMGKQNSDNLSYRKCILRKGFLDYTYWSSTLYFDYARTVNLHFGHTGKDTLDDLFSGVTCIRVR